MLSRWLGIVQFNPPIYDCCVFQFPVASNELYPGSTRSNPSTYVSSFAQLERASSISL